MKGCSGSMPRRLCRIAVRPGSALFEGDHQIGTPGH
jgi:hypothetical protein